MKHIPTFEGFLNEAYKQVSPTTKISGKYEITIAGKKQETLIAGFERQDDDNDSLYFMDNDPFKAAYGSLVVKNSDMPKLEKGTVVTAKTTKDNKEAKIKRIGDL